MQIRAATPADLAMIPEIDATIESSQYLHLDITGEGMALNLKLEPRPMRSKLIQSNPLGDEQSFTIKQIIGGAFEGTALVAEHDGTLVGLAIAQPRHELGTLHLVDVRVDSDFRRQGLATAMVYQLINAARENELRAVSAETSANNFPANQMLQKLGFDMSGLDTKRHTNHDVVKEMTTILWYAALDK